MIISDQMLVMISKWRLTSDKEKITYCKEERVVIGLMYISLKLEERSRARIWTPEEEVVVHGTKG